MSILEQVTNLIHTMKTKTLIIVLSALILGVINISLLTSEKNPGYILDALSKIALAADEGSYSPSDPVWMKLEGPATYTTTYYDIPCSGGMVKHCVKSGRTVNVTCSYTGSGVSCYPGPATTGITYCGDCGK